MLSARHIAAALTALFIATPIMAQDSTRVDSSPASVTVVSPASGDSASLGAALPTAVPLMSLAPTRASVATGVQLRMDGVAPAPMPIPAPGRNSGNTALMIVGGAALIVGSVIDGDAGSIIMIGGGVIGLYGLWQYLR